MRQISGIFSESMPSTVQIKDYISIDDNLLSEDDTLPTSDVINCNEDDLSEEETDQHDEEYESISDPTYEEVLKNNK